MNNDELITAVREAVADVHTATPAEQIISRGRTVRARRRIPAIAGTLAAVTGTVLGLGLTGALGAAPARSAGTIRTVAPARSTGTIRTAAFTLTSNANGTDTLTLTHSQMFDPAALQQALARHGIRALVKTDTYCSSNPAAPDPLSVGVLSVRPPVKPPHGGAAPHGTAMNRIVAHTVTVINPAAMPSRTELFFGYFNSGHLLSFGLIYTSSYTCSNGQPPAATP